VKYVATGDDGVTASCTFNVRVAYRQVNLEVDQLVTPNGDGINDKLQVKNLQLFTDNHVIIVDRWGGLIYDASGYDNESVAWDGSNANGAKAPSGTYFYTISVIFRGQKTTKTGFIELAR
jgi:gliding motility-associated-like protein